MKNSLVFIVFAIVAFFDCYAQLSSYVVISFETQRNIDKFSQIYYWIADVNSIKDVNFTIYPLYLDDYSKDNFDECQKGDSIDPFVSTNLTGRHFDKDYDNNVEKLTCLINNNRIKIQTINVSWETNKKAKYIVNVYATPIIGNFCRCFLIHTKFMKYKSYIYLPFSDFSLFEYFWKTSTASIVKSTYYIIDFKNYPFNKKGVQISSDW